MSNTLRIDMYGFWYDNCKGMASNQLCFTAYSIESFISGGGGGGNSSGKGEGMLVEKFE